MSGCDGDNGDYGNGGGSDDDSAVKFVLQYEKNGQSNEQKRKT